jgi:hypothetical protein
MTSFLVEMSKAGLDLQLQGDDSRLDKYEAASEALAERLADDPAAYVGAVLAGLDPDTPADDAALKLAQEALVESWHSVESIFTDAPRGIFRALLLDACGAAERDDAPAIVWLTAADTLPMCRLGRQEAPVVGLLTRLAERVEQKAVGIAAAPALAKVGVKVGVEVASKAVSKALAPSNVDRDALARRVEAAVGPHNRTNNPPLVNANPHWPNQPEHWAWQFADRMTPLLADQLDDVLKKNAELGDTLHASLTTSQTALATSVTQALSAQQDWVQRAIASAKVQQDAERLRVSALWWSEALYSPRLRRSYRALPPALAAVVMALDLHTLTPSLPPASVGYLLAETVNRLPEASFEQTRPLVEWLGILRGATGVDLGKIGAALCAPPTHGRVSVRDVLAATLRGASPDPALLNRLPGGPDTPMSLPNLAHALFRQEKALLLAGGEP